MSLGRSTLVMTAGTLVSRILGFVRTALLAATLAAVGLSANAFDLANKIPSILQMLIAGGVLNAVLVPQVVRAYERAKADPASAVAGTSGDAFVSRLLTVGGAILLGLTVVFTAGSGLLVTFYADGGEDLAALATAFAFWCMPQIFFYGVYTLLGQVLNARGSFGPYMWAPVVNNVIAIAGLGVFIWLFGRPGATVGVDWWDGPKIAVLAGTATLGVVGQAVVLIPFLRRLGFRFRLTWGVRGVGLGSAARVAGWTFAALLVGQGAYLLATNIMTAAERVAGAEGDHVAGNAAYSIAFMLSMLPHSLITVSLVTAMFTALSKHAAAGRRDAVRADFSHGLRLLAVFTSFASVGLAVIALPLSRVMLPGNSDGEVRAVAGVVVALLAGLVALGAWALVQRVFYAYEDARGLFWIQVPMAIVVAGGAFLSQALLPPEWWVVGVAAAMAVSNWLGAFVGVVRLRGRLGGVDGARVVRLHVRTGLAALLAGGAAWAMLHRIGGLESLTWWGAVGVCAAGGVAMLLAYVALLRLMRVRELSSLLGPVLRRFGRAA